ncbi:MAG: FGGY family carbohydrate kinase [Nakamurella sp.]
MTTLCLDAGTTLIKAVVFDEQGNELVVTKRPTVVSSPRPGHAEQDMTEVMAALVAAAAEAVSRSPQPIDLISITAQGDGAWMVDRAGDPVGPAMLWNDARAVEVIRRWQDEGVLDAAFAVNGSLSNLGLPHAIMSSLLTADPQAMDRVAHVLTCGSWVFLNLTGLVGLHISEASAPWLDIAHDTYSAQLLDLYGLTAQGGLIPPVLTSTEVVQPLLPAIADRIGCAAGIPVVLAPYDVVATAAGGGSVAPGAAFCILGTTLCTGVLMAAPDTTGVPSGLTLRVAAGGPVIRAFPTLAGTGVVDWLAGMTGAADAAAVTALAASSVPGAHGIRVWPYLSPAGERAPFLDADARGMITGLSFSHTPADLARATVEGLAHVVRDCLSAIPTRPSDIAISGGGSASDIWCAAIADVTGTATVRTADSQIGAKGAMIHAVVATGEYGSVADAARALVRHGRRFEPDPELGAFYDGRHADFLESRELIAPRWPVWTGS